jgi:predicted transcriptional regulator
MRIIWARGPATAEAVGAALSRPLKNATVRTLLRRMEGKGYVRHRADGRAFVYEARVQPGAAVTTAVRRVVDRFCGGSVERLLVGLVDEGLIDRDELRALERRIAERERDGR